MNKLIAIVSGIILSVVVGYVGSNFVGGSASDFLRYAGVLIGAVLAGFLAKKKGWFVGGVVSVLVVLVLGFILSEVAYRASDGNVLWASETSVLVPSLITIVVGIVGGILGQYLAARISARQSS